MTEFNAHGKLIPPIGMVPLKDKTIPICDKSGPYDNAYAYTRAVVDVSSFKKKLLSLPPETWEDAFQQGTFLLSIFHISRVMTTVNILHLNDTFSRNQCEVDASSA